MHSYSIIHHSRRVGASSLNRKNPDVELTQTLQFNDPASMPQHVGSQYLELLADEREEEEALRQLEEEERRESAAAAEAAGARQRASKAAASSSAPQGGGEADQALSKKGATAAPAAAAAVPIQRKISYYEVTDDCLHLIDWGVGPTI